MYIFFSLPFSYFKFTVDHQLSFQIDPLNLLSLVVTTFLALYVVRVLNRKEDADKAERSLLSGYFAEFESKFAEEVCKISNEEDGVDGTVVATTFQKYGMSLQALLDLARSHASRDELSLSALERSVSEIRELLSNTPTEGTIEDGVRLSGTLISYSPRYRNDIIASLGRFKKAIFSVIVSINNY